MARRSPLRTLAWIIAVVMFILAATYALGGAPMFRTMRARVRAFMEPPTPAQMQRAVATEERQSALDSVIRADTTHAGRSDAPASLPFILEVITGTLAGIVVLLIVSARGSGTKTRSER